MTSAETEPKPVVHEAKLYVKAKYDDVWTHLTDAKKFAAWNSAPGLKFGDKAGDVVSWGGEKGAVYSGKLLAIKKGEGLSHTFAFQGFGFEETSKVSYDVVACGPVVLIHLRHDCTGAPNTGKIIGPLGWTKSLSRLKTLLESGEAMPWPVDE